MKLLYIAAALSVAGCGANYPVPTQRMADAQSANRSARELGADKVPTAQLHMKLAEEQIAKAKTILEGEENRRADFMLIRARADAELALALAHEKKQRTEADKAIADSNAQRLTNSAQGAVR